MSIISTSDASFEEDVLTNEKPVLVDFWAEWCGPCKALLPVLEETATELGDKVQVVKVNIDENQMTPAKYGVRGIPTLMIFKGGELKATRVGSANKQDLLTWIEENS